MSTYYFCPHGMSLVREVCRSRCSCENIKCQKILIVTDAFLAESGMADKVAAIYQQVGIGVHIFYGAEPNPTDRNVEGD